MKLYLLSPVIAANSDETATEARHRQCNEMIANLIIEHVGNDPGLFGLRHVHETSAAAIETDLRFGAIEAVKVGNSDMLRTILLANGNPYGGKSMLIRSLVSCRAVFHGYDGQAMVCLPTSADPIVSPDESMITVEDCSDLLVNSDWMDGLTD